VKTTRCLELTRRFDPIYPAGHSNFRIPMEATDYRVFVKRTEGSRVWDEDDNEYIDYMGGQGANLLGHRHPEWTNAIKEYLEDRSPYFSSGVLNSHDDVAVGERLLEHIPCAEGIKFCLSGSEAVQIAIRLARAYTNRPRVLRFAGQYHGWMDNVIGGQLDPNREGRPFPFESPDSSSLDDPCYTRGKGPGSVEQSFLLPWNDVDALEETFGQFGQEIALVLMEAIPTNHFCLMPKPAFLDKIRALCDEHGVLLCFDEVITGFRLGLGGAQEMVGVTPDIATYGKALAGGLPFSAVMGKASVLNQLRDGTVLSPGTFNGYPMGMRAVLTTLNILERDDGAVYAAMDRIQQRIEEGITEIGSRRGIPLRVQGVRGVFYVLFGLDGDTEVYTDEDLAQLDFGQLVEFWRTMQQEGVLTFMAGRWFVSIVHTDADVDRTLEAADKCMAGLQ
jgi:glutamate-1-semialdehyde 2,1-aminomutase